MHERRYAEAGAYLRTALQTLPGGESPFPLILLLADAQLTIGDRAAAQATLNEAEARAITEAQKKAVTVRFRRLSELPHVSAVADQAGTEDLSSEDSLTQPQALVTNSFFETDLRQVLADLSSQTGVPIVWDAATQGLVTYEANKQPLEDVLKAILTPLGFSFRRDEGTYFVGSSSPKDPAFAMVSETRVVTLSNMDAEIAIGLLSDYFDPYVKADKTTNTVCITAPATIATRIEQDLKLLDKPPPQILIEVIVCELSKDALYKMGLDWSLTRTAGSNPSWSIGTNHTDIPNAAPSGSYTDIGYKIGKYTADLTASLEALESSGDAQIRAKPRITTLNGRTAEISLTRDQYFIIQTGSSQLYQYNTLQAVTSGIKLQITPYAAESGEITVYVKPEVGDVVGEGAQGLPEINKRAASTSVRVHDGETFTVGGLNIQRQKNIRRGIPFLSDIPFLGYLFRYSEHEAVDTEIIIFVTPYLLAR